VITGCNSRKKKNLRTLENYPEIKELVFRENLGDVDTGVICCACILAIRRKRLHVRVQNMDKRLQYSGNQSSSNEVVESYHERPKPQQQNRSRTDAELLLLFAKDDSQLGKATSIAQILEQSSNSKPASRPEIEDFEFTEGQEVHGQLAVDIRTSELASLHLRNTILSQLALNWSLFVEFQNFNQNFVRGVVDLSLLQLIPKMAEAASVTCGLLLQIFPQMDGLSRDVKFFSEKQNILNAYKASNSTYTVQQLNDVITSSLWVFVGLCADPVSSQL
jgi:hypothetical protein